MGSSKEWDKDMTTHQHFISPTILRLPAVKFASGLSRSSLYVRISQGLWPRPVSLGARAVGWPSNEVATMINALIAGKTDSEIRELVTELEVARKHGGNFGGTW